MALIFAVTFLVIWQRDRSQKSNLALGIGWLMLACGMLISQLSPAHLGRILVVITHVPYTLAGLGMCSGILLRVGVIPPVRAFLGIGLTGLFALLLTQAIGESIKADLLITNITSGVMMVMTTQSFAQAGRRDGIEQFMLVTLIVVTAQFFLRPVLSFMFDDTIAAEQYRESTYYMTLAWLFGFGSVAFGLAQLAASVKDQFNALHRNSATDDLSGLLARGEFEMQVADALSRASSTGVSVSLIIGDIDHFKQVNDIWGHQVGDRVIAEFGAMIRNMIRDCDIAGRVGGEEFCVLVWDVNEANAFGLAERLRKSAVQLEIESGNLDVRLTASFGVALRAGSESYRSLFARADKALYEAKQKDRNRVVRAGSDGWNGDGNLSRRGQAA